MPENQWSPQQERALTDVAAWLADPHGTQVYELFGFAGTGKTTLARFLASTVAGRVYFAAFTGKAAHVLRQKGCSNATTVHKLLYRPAGDTPESPELRAARGRLDQAEDDATKIEQKCREDGETTTAVPAVLINARASRDDMRRKVQALEAREPRRSPMFTFNEATEATGASLIVLDEVSMVDRKMGEDLERTGARLLVLGDPAQLPPVGGGGYFTNREPRTLLTEVHRQAHDSGILQLATMVREGKTIRTGQYGSDCLVINQSSADRQMHALEADQILVGRNKTRHATNAKMRTLLGLGGGSPFPMSGDRLVCLRNNHDLGMLNGSTWRVHQATCNVDDMLATLEISSLEDPAAPPLVVVSWMHHFLGREEALSRMGWDRRHYEEFGYGYALTVHKAQGSGFPDVFLHDESDAFGRDVAPKHLYTGITRASKSLVVVIP